MKIYECISLKTKGFSRDTEALIWIGGGENRTGMVRCSFSIDKSNKIPHQFTQILRTRRDETSLKLVVFWPLFLCFVVLDVK